MLREHIKELMIRIKEIKEQNPNDPRLEQLYKELEFYTEGLGRNTQK